MLTPDLDKLTENINEQVGYKPGQIQFSPNVTNELGCEDCSCYGLLSGAISVSVPEGDLQEIVRQAVTKFAGEKGLHFVITEPQYCAKGIHAQAHMGCAGHYLDPFKAEFNDERVHIDKFPADLSGTTIHFLNPKNFGIYQQIVAPTSDGFGDEYKLSTPAQPRVAL